MKHVIINENETIEGAAYWTNDKTLGMVAFDECGNALCTFGFDGNYSHSMINKAAGVQVYYKNAPELGWNHDANTWRQLFVWAGREYGVADAF